MPMSLDFGRVVDPFRDRFELQFSAIQRAFDRIGDWLDSRLDAARDLERATQAYPTVDFFNSGVTAAIDRSQFGKLASQPAPSFGSSLAEGGRQFVSGLAQIPRGAEASVVIPRALRAAADMFERIAASLDRARTGGKLNDFLDRVADAMNTGGGPPHPGMFDALLKVAPRMAPAVAAIVRSLAEFLRSLGTGAGPKQFDAFTGGLAALQQAWRATFPGAGASGGDPLAAVRDATRYVSAALAALPWLGVYLPIVWQLGQLAIRLATLSALESIEGQVWDFRASVLKFFYVDLELFRRAAIVWLTAAQGVLVGQLRYYVTFVSIYLDEVLIGLRRLSNDITGVLGKIATVLNALKIALTVLSDFDFLNLIAPGLPVPSPFTLARLAETVIEGNAALAAGLATGLDLVEPFATPEQKVLINILRRLTRLPSFLSKLPPTPEAPSVEPLPNLVDQFFGGGASAWTNLLGHMRDAIQLAVEDVLSTTVTGLSTASSRFAQLRDEAAGLDLTQRFSAVISASEDRTQQLMAPHVQWLAEHAGPTGLEDIAGAFEDVLATGGFDVVGAAIPAYIGSLRDLWAPEFAAGGETPTSPHILARRARLTLVHLPRLTIRAVGRALDESLRTDIAARAQAAIADAYQRGTATLAPAGATP